MDGDTCKFLIITQLHILGSQPSCKPETAHTSANCIYVCIGVNRMIKILFYLPLGFEKMDLKLMPKQELKEIKIEELF